MRLQHARKARRQFGKRTEDFRFGKFGERNRNFTGARKNVAWRYGKDIYESGKHSLYISRVEQRIQSYRDGTFTEMENHHAPYPDDFPDPKNLPEATAENTFLCWRNNVPLSESSYQVGCVEYVYAIDEDHMVILEPVALELMDGTIAYTFADTEYIDADVKEWFETKYDGIYENYQ